MALAGSMQTKVAVVIVSYQSREFILKCLTSLETGQGDPAITIVDNASTDGTPAAIRKHFPWVKVLESPRNLGFAAGVNWGIREAPKVPYIFLVNPDAIVLPGTIPRMVDFADNFARVGILGPQVFDDIECRIRYPSCRRFPNLTTTLFNHSSFLTRLFGYNHFSRSYLYIGEDLSQPRYVDWVSGSTMLIRRALLDDIGLFDESFFFYYEDIDFCWRAHHAAWQVMYYPEAKVVHFRGKSAEKIPYQVLVAKHRSMVRLYKKHIRKSVLTDPFIFVGGWARLGLLLGHGALRRLHS